MLSIVDGDEERNEYRCEVLTFYFYVAIWVGTLKKRGHIGFDSLAD